MRTEYLTQFLFCFFLPFWTLAAEEITICRPNNMVSALLYVAEDQGYFQEAGIIPKFETVSNVKICFDLMSSGKAMVTNGAEGPFAYIAALQPPFRIVAKLIGNPDTAVYARKDSGITSLADLKGKRIGYLPGTISFLLLARLMEKYNWQKSDFKLASMQPAAMPAALTGGVIDAFLMWEPWGSQALNQLGNNGIIFPMNDLYVTNTQLVVHNKLLEGSPETVRKILTAYIKAEEYIAHNPQKTIELISRRTSYPLEVLKKNWKDYDIKVTFDETIKGLLKEDFKLLRKYDENFSDTVEPDFERFMYPGFLEVKNIL